MTCTLVPFGQGHVLQSIGVLPAMPPVSNRVCELTLQAVSPGSNQFEIIDAECKDCNELECGSSCPQSIGSFMTIPGGLNGL